MGTLSLYSHLYPSLWLVPSTLSLVASSCRLSPVACLLCLVACPLRLVAFIFFPHLPSCGLCQRLRLTCVGRHLLHSVLPRPGYYYPRYFFVQRLHNDPGLYLRMFRKLFFLFLPC